MKKLLTRLCRATTFGGLAILGTLRGRTLLDLKAQSKNIDFSGAAATRPVKTGTALPSICKTGELFFNSSASAGLNLYGCSTSNNWSQESGGSTQVAAGALSGVLLLTSSNRNLLRDGHDNQRELRGCGHNIPDDGRRPQCPSGNMTPSAGIWDLSAVDGLIVRNGSSDPSTCSVGELFVNTAGMPALKLCTSADTWTASGSSGLAPGQIRTLQTGQSSAICPSGQTVLASYTIPANTLAAGDVLDIRTVWRKTGTSNIGQMKTLFGAEQVGPTVTINSTEAFAVTEASLYMSGPSSERALTRTLRENTATGVTVGSGSEPVAGGIASLLQAKLAAVAIHWLSTGSISW